MRILVTNDDGAGAEGILVLARAASQLGEVKIVAPDRERSACGHAMTLRDPLRVDPYPLGDFETVVVNGFPVDCINVGLTLLWPDGCDLVLSGFNPGPNMGFDATYSGTVAGAMEGGVNGIKSFAFSMCPFAIGAPFHFATGEEWLKSQFDWLLSLPNGEHTFYNVNVPAIEFEQLEGCVLTEMGRRVYEDRVERREDPWGRPYFWQGGTMVAYNDREGTDIWAVTNKMVSVTPMSLDWTDQRLLERARAPV